MGILRKRDSEQAKEFQKRTLRLGRATLRWQQIAGLAAIFSLLGLAVQLSGFGGDPGEQSSERRTEQPFFTGRGSDLRWSLTASDRRQWFYPSRALERPDVLPPTNGCISDEQKVTLTNLGGRANDVAVDVTLATENPVAVIVTSVALTFLERIEVPEGALMRTCSGAGDNYPKEISVPLEGPSIGENLLQRGDTVVYYEVTPNHPGIVILLPRTARSGMYSWRAELNVRVGNDDVIIPINKAGHPFVTIIK